MYQNYTGYQLTGDHELVAGRNRLRVQFNQSLPFGTLYAEIDFLDKYADERDFEILPRQMYADWYTSNYDIRIGKQNVIWGESIDTFVNDIITPVDLSEFLTQSPEDLRVGVTAVNIRRYFGSHSLQLIITPAIQPDRLPDPDSRWFPIEQPPTFIPVSFRERDRSPALSDVQTALRFAWRPSASLDVDFMLYRWAHPMPAYSVRPAIQEFPNTPEVSLRENYKTSPMAGYSLSWQISDRWSFVSEALYVYSRLFTYLPVSVNRLESALDNPAEILPLLQEFEIRDDGYLLTKPWLHTMAGMQADLWDTIVGVQAYTELILNYEERILSQQLFPYLSAFAQRTFLRERLALTANGRYNIYGEDFWAQIRTSYEINDGFEVAMGTNLFGGPSISPFYGHLSFELFKENSFGFVQTSIYF
ncbi:hypothetical protein DYD21_06270 [Rhodohalobacter sp. SW132]|uniref:DUF1302 domain-containing protein n=1 Tax=Rhodohalobacter sp. SW132 TaxID=2293433 RepID=UPI000E398283|nr:DUF1302 domain-containing protein [Rhodohalobacter sp. SW132]REL38211.1 hypothetical protein DYD21_06270 [Rhodohalobacter sp. SW132]